jgi:3-dehydroquinate synthetase
MNPSSAKDDEQYVKTMVQWTLFHVVHHNITNIEYMAELCKYGGLLQRSVIDALQNYMEKYKTSGDRDIDQTIKSIIAIK